MNNRGNGRGMEQCNWGIIQTEPVITGEMRNEYNRKNRELLSASFSVIFCRKLIWLSSYEKKKKLILSF